MRREPAKGSPFLAPFPVHQASFVVGAEATNVINVGVQLKDVDSVNLAVRGHVDAYLSADANGDTLAAAPSGGVAVGTDGLCIEQIADRSFTLVSEANGHLDINITEAGAGTWYLVLRLPGGTLAVSGAITFA
jgi:hypothetical protein